MTISSTGGGATYTAGDGIEITQQNVINNTAPNKLISITVDEQTMELDKTAGEINSLIEQGYLILLMGRLMFIEEYDSSRNILYAYFYSGGFATKFTITGHQVTDYESLDVVYDNHYTHTDNNFSNSYRNKLDNAIDKYIVNFTIESDTISADKTISEIISAYSAGKIIEGTYTDSDSGVTATLNFLMAQDMSDFLLAQFNCFSDNGDDVLAFSIIGTNGGSDDSWQLIQRDLVTDDEMSSYELRANKTTSLSSSSTDTQYPSYDALQGAGGDVGYFVNIYPNYFSTLDTTNVQNIINKMLETSLNQVYLITQRSGYRNYDLCVASLDSDLSTSTTSYVLNVWKFGFNNDIKNIDHSRKTYNVTISWNNNVPTVTNVSGSGNVVTNNIYLNGNTSSWTPSTNYSPASKKYVDELYKSYTGYDATKTQVLKNINGTLTWVDET